jgi:hypothetical protein
MVNILSRYPDVQVILVRLLDDVTSVLHADLTGLYLHGSLAYGDFNPSSSDIDFLVVTGNPLSTSTFLALKEMHSRLFQSGLAWSQKLEGAYVPAADLCHYDAAHLPIPWLGSDGHFALEVIGRDWDIQRWILREKGLVVAGPSIRELIDPINPQDLKEAVLESLRGWWSPPLPSPERFESPDYKAYGVLTMCRSLFVLRKGRIASKPEAARWALEAYPQWDGLIRKALDWQDGKNLEILDGTFDFIYYTLGQAGLRLNEKNDTR